MDPTGSRSSIHQPNIIRQAPTRITTVTSNSQVGTYVPAQSIHAREILTTTSGTTHYKDAGEIRRAFEDTAKKLSIAYLENDRLSKEVQDLRGGQRNSGEVESLRNENNTLRSEISKGNEVGNGLRNQVNALNSQISQLNHQYQADKQRAEKAAALERENETLRMELNNLRQTRQSQNPAIDDLRNDLTMLASENERLQSQLQQLRANSQRESGLASQVENLRRELETLSRFNQDLRNNEGRMLSDLRNKDNTIQDLHQQIKNLAAANGEVSMLKLVKSQLEDQLRIRDATIEDLRRQLSNQVSVSLLRSEVDSLKARLAEKENCIADLKKKLENSVSIDHLNNLKAQLVNLGSENGKLQRELDILKQHAPLLAETQDKLAKALLEKQELLKRIHGLEEDLKAARNSLGDHSRCDVTIAELKNLINTQSQNLLKLESDLADLSAKYKSKEAEIHNLESNIQKLTHELEELKKNRELNSSELATKIEHLLSQIADLEGKYKLLEHERDSLISQRDALKNERDSLKNERDSLKNDLEVIKREEGALKNERDSLKNELELLKRELEAFKGDKGSHIQTLNELHNAKLLIERLNQEIAHLRPLSEKLPPLEQEREDLLRKIAAITSTFQTLTSDHEIVVSNFDKLKAIQAQSSSITVPKEHYDQLTLDYNSLQAKYNRLVEENGHLAKQLGDMVATKDHLLTANTGLKGEIEGLHRMIDELKNNGLREEISKHIQENNQLRFKITQLNEQIILFEGRIKQHEHENAERIKTSMPFGSFLEGGQLSADQKEQLRLLLIENERLLAKIGMLENSIAGLQQVSVQRDELLLDLGMLKAAKKRSDDRMDEMSKEAENLKLAIFDLGEELKLKCRIIDEKTFMLLDLEKEYNRLKNDKSEVKRLTYDINQLKDTVHDLEKENDKLRLEIARLKEEFLFTNQTELSLLHTRKGLEDEKDMNSTKETTIRGLEDKLSLASKSISGIPILNQSNQALKDEVFKLQNLNQEKDLLLYKMKEIADEMQHEIDTIPGLKSTIENQKAEMARLNHLISQKDEILAEFADKLDILKESLSQIVILEEKIKYLEAENQRLNKSLNAKETHLNSFQEGLSDMQRLSKSIPDLQLSNKMLKDDLERSVRQSKEKEGLLNAERERFKSYIEDLQKQNAGYLQQIGDLEKLLREMKIKETATANENSANQNMLHNKIRELVLAMTHLKEENESLEEEIAELKPKLAELEKDLLGLIAIRKERDTAISELEKAQNDKRMLTVLNKNCEEKITRLEGNVSKLRITENEVTHLKEANRELQNRIQELIMQREKINNEVNLSIDKGKMNNYNLQLTIDELRAQVKALNDKVLFKDREIAILKVQEDELLEKLKAGDKTRHAAEARVEELDREYKSSQTQLSERNDQLEQALKVVLSLSRKSICSRKVQQFMERPMAMSISRRSTISSSSFTIN